MERDYTKEYEYLHRRTLARGNILAKFFGYNSCILEKYLNSQQDKIYMFENEAYDAQKRIHNRVNLSLASKLLSLNTDVLLARH